VADRRCRKCRRKIPRSKAAKARKPAWPARPKKPARPLRAPWLRSSRKKIRPRRPSRATAEPVFPRGGSGPSLEPLSDDVPLGRALAARGWFGVLDGAEVLLE